MTIEEFTERANIVHDNVYSYSSTTYFNSRKKVDITCHIHGIFSQSPRCHLEGQGCYKCTTNRFITTEDFIKKAIEVHGDKYSYSAATYLGSNIKLDIICKTHGIFPQIPHNHLNGKGCPNCNMKKGEVAVKLFLETNIISFTTQKSFDGCIFKKKLKFDFYLPEYNLCIEYDGKQHFKSINYFGGDENFKIRQLRDNIKNEFCKNNDIGLLRIRYDENITQKLEERLLPFIQKEI